MTEGRSKFVVVYLSLSISHFVSVGSLSVAVDHDGLVAVGRSLWDDRYGKIAMLVGCLCWAS